jgi:hypothetical protein
MGVLQHLHIANSLFKYSLILPLPFGVISGAHYTGLNINTAVFGWGKFEICEGDSGISVVGSKVMFLLIVG